MTAEDANQGSGSSPDDTGDQAQGLDIADTHRFNQFIWAENERLNRLIRNLYLQFQLKHFTERDLYDRICEEVANYFMADSCSLYLVRYEETEQQKPVPAVDPSGSHTSRSHLLTKWLELVGAEGPWRRALRQQYVRRRSAARYELPFENQHEDFLSATCRGFASTGAHCYLSTYRLPRYESSCGLSATSASDTELPTEAQQTLQEDIPRQVVWRNDNLYNTFRSMVLAPLIRQSQQQHDPHHHIGVIKVENRSPASVVGYARVPLSTESSQHLFFDREWGVAALYPYICDLCQRSAQGGADPYEPLVNDVGWQQYFEDNPAGNQYYEQLLNHLRTKRKSGHSSERAEHLVKQYGELQTWLLALTECLVRLETWLQHLRYGCQVLCGLGRPPSIDRPTRSVFNVYNLRAAYMIYLQNVAGAVEHGLLEEPSWYTSVRDAFLDRLPLASEQGEQIRAQAHLLTTIDVLLARLADQRAGDWPKTALNWLASAVTGTPPDAPYLARAERVADAIKQCQPARQSQTPHLAAAETLVVEIRALRDAVYHTLDNQLEDACRRRTEQTRNLIAPDAEVPDTAFRVADVLESDSPHPTPSWKLDEAIVKTVIDDLRAIAKTLGDAPKPTGATLPAPEIAHQLQLERYEVAAETAETQNVTAAVKQTLQQLPPPEASDEQTPAVTRSIPQLVRFCAELLADATMCADSFNSVDRSRLLFIASHVAQILDNQLLYNARQRALKIDYESLGSMGLTSFGLELLDRIDFELDQIDRALLHLATRRLYKGDDFSRKDTPIGLSHAVVSSCSIIERLAERMRKPPRAEHTDAVCDTLELLSIAHDDQHALSYVLQEIAVNASQLNLPKCDSPRAAHQSESLRFSPREGIQQPGFNDSVELDVRLEQAALSDPRQSILVSCDQKTPEAANEHALAPTPKSPDLMSPRWRLLVALVMPTKPDSGRDARCLWIVMMMLTDLADTLNLACGTASNVRE